MKTPINTKQHNISLSSTHYFIFTKFLSQMAAGVKYLAHGAEVAAVYGTTAAASPRFPGCAVRRLRVLVFVGDAPACSSFQAEQRSAHRLLERIAGALPFELAAPVAYCYCLASYAMQTGDAVVVVAVVVVKAVQPPHWLGVAGDKLPAVAVQTWWHLTEHSHFGS